MLGLGRGGKFGWIRDGEDVPSFLFEVGVWWLRDFLGGDGEVVGFEVVY